MAAQKPLPLDTLMELAQAGDKTAYHELLSRCSTILRGFIAKRISDYSAAEDIVQEVLISIHKAQHTYDPTRPFMPWMFAIANFRLADYLRKFYKNEEISLEFTDDFSEGDPENVTFTYHKYEYLYKAIEQLSDRQRNIVLLLKIEGLTIKEVSKACSLSESAVKVTAHRAYKTLRRILEQQDKE
jgi:RNA polymerase sigma-70 factor (ECF subfamily)